MAKNKNILVLTYWSYKDPLVQAYTLPYVRIIRKLLPSESKIFLVTFDQGSFIMTREQESNEKENLSKEGISLISLRYKKLTVFSMIYILLNIVSLIKIILENKINYIHSWCMPAGSLGYILSLVTGKKLIVDSYEPHAESMVENGTWKKTNIKFKIQFYFEKKLTHRAEYLICTTEGMKKYALEKYNILIEKSFIKPACVEDLFFSDSHIKKAELLEYYNLTDKIVCVYAGKFGGIYLSNEIFEFLKCAKDYWGDKFIALLFTNYPAIELRQWADDSGFPREQLLIEYVDHKKIADYLGLGDFAITPVRPLPSKRFCTPIKDGEYWALGLPVVIPDNISDDSIIIRENRIGSVLNSLDNNSYKNSIQEIDNLLSENKSELKNKIRKIARKYRSYSIAEIIYKEIYE